VHKININKLEDKFMLTMTDGDTPQPSVLHISLILKMELQTLINHVINHNGSILKGTHGDYILFPTYQKATHFKENFIEPLLVMNKLAPTKLSKTQTILNLTQALHIQTIQINSLTNS
jgi:hypothetical protein